eukprot:96917-Pleurochrysis_carterae.AAC.1
MSAPARDENQDMCAISSTRVFCRSMCYGTQVEVFRGHKQSSRVSSKTSDASRNAASRERYFQTGGRLCDRKDRNRDNSSCVLT